MWQWLSCLPGRSARVGALQGPWTAAAALDGRGCAGLHACTRAHCTLPCPPPQRGMKSTPSRRAKHGKHAQRAGARTCTPGCVSCMNSNSLLTTVFRNFQWLRRKRGYCPTTYLQGGAVQIGSTGWQYGMGGWVGWDGRGGAAARGACRVCVKPQEGAQIVRSKRQPIAVRPTCPTPPRAALRPACPTHPRAALT